MQLGTCFISLFHGLVSSLVSGRHGNWLCLLVRSQLGWCRIHKGVWVPAVDHDIVSAPETHLSHHRQGNEPEAEGHFRAVS